MRYIVVPKRDWPIPPPIRWGTYPSPWTTGLGPTAITPIFILTSLNHSSDCSEETEGKNEKCEQKDCPWWLFVLFLEFIQSHQRTRRTSGVQRHGSQHKRWKTEPVERRVTKYKIPLRSLADLKRYSKSPWSSFSVTIMNELRTSLFWQLCYDMIFYLPPTLHGCIMIHVQKYYIMYS